MISPRTRAPSTHPKMMARFLWSLGLAPGVEEDVADAAALASEAEEAVDEGTGVKDEDEDDDDEDDDDVVDVVEVEEVDEEVVVTESLLDVAAAEAAPFEASDARIEVTSV